MIRVLIVDDHPFFRAGLEAALEELPGVEPCGAVASADDALLAVGSASPDVVLMDVDLGGSSGIDATAAITTAHPDVAVLMLTMYDSEASVFAALCAGARGYLLKGADQEEVRRAVVAAAAGEAVFGAGVAKRVLAASRTGARVTGDAPVPTGLTERERQILDLMATGWGNQEIAQRLYLAPKTVRNNVSSILGKLAAASRGEAIVKARRMGFGSDEGASGS